MDDTVLVERPNLSLYEFLLQSWHVLEPMATPFVDSWYIKPLCDVLEAVTYGRFKNVAINVPPGMTKSRLVSVVWPAWTWTVQPHISFLGASHAKELAVRDAENQRDLVTSEWYQRRWGLGLTRNRVTYFRNVESGYRRITSVGAKGTTGHRATKLILDDYIDAERMHSDRIREKSNRWVRNTFFNRVNSEDTAGRVFIGQRLHEGDIFGLIERGQLGDDWVWVVLPMEYEERPPEDQRILAFEDPRKPGELLAPERFDQHAVSEAKTTLGTLGFALQHQQRGSAKEGVIFLRHRWRKYSQLPAITHKVLSLDCAFGDGESHDGSQVACTVWGKQSRTSADAYLLDGRSDFLGLDGTIRLVKDMRAKWPDLKYLLIENKSNGPAVIQTLHKVIPGIVPINPTGEKQERAWAIQPFHEAGNLWVPDPAWAGGWVLEYLDQMAAFPNGLLDDYVDSTTQAVYRLLVEGGTATHVPGRRPR